MKTVYWIGIKESDLDDIQGIFKKSITFFGTNTEKNVSFSDTYKYRINHNLDNNDINLFIAQSIQDILKEDEEACFMYFSPYHSYFLPDQLKNRVFCQNKQEVLALIRSKINTRFWLSYSVPIVPSVLISADQCHYNDVEKLFKNKASKYVVQKNYSAGGYSTLLLSKNDQIINENNELLLVSPYISNSIPLNITVIIYEEDILVFPGSIQIIAEDQNRLLYKGADFITYKDISKNIRDKVCKYVNIIGNNLQNIGYRGICGIDFISDGQEVYFMEVNERFQASTYLINLALKEQGYDSVQKMCIDSFHTPKCRIDLSEFKVKYSNYIYSYHKYYEHCYSYIFQKARKNNNIYRIVNDGFENMNSCEEDAYLFALVFNINITSINDDGGVNVENNIKPEKQLRKDDVLKIKISLMNQGFSLSKSAEDYIMKNGNVRLAINKGMDLTIFDSIRVSSVYHDKRLINLSPFELKYNTETGLVLTHYGNILSTVTYDIQDKLSNRKTCDGIPYSAIAFLATTRLQINHEPVCFYKKNNISCKFCGLPQDGITFLPEDTYEVINAYIAECDFDKFLIGGASNTLLMDGTIF